MYRNLVLLTTLVILASVTSSVAAADDPPRGTSPPAASEPTAAVEAAAQRPDKPADDQELNRPIGRIFQDIGSDLAHLATPRSLLWIGAGAAGAAAVEPLDNKVSVKPGQEWARWSEVFDPGTYIGNSLVLMGGSAFTYTFGRITDRPRAAHVGRDLLRAQVVSQIVVQSLKASVNRQRPDLSGNNSFPSGHAATTFASAVVFQRHLGLKWAIPTYLVATYVATSRLHENRHHLSDVVMGAGLGIATGMATTRHATKSWALVPTAVPGGAAVLVMR